MKPERGITTPAVAAKWFEEQIENLDKEREKMNNASVSLGISPIVLSTGRLVKATLKVADCDEDD